MQLRKLTEQWTPTSIQASFSMLSLKSLPDQETVILELPIINLGWTFAVTLTTGFSEGSFVRTVCNRWRPSSWAFHGHDSTIPWENASMTAKLWLHCNDPPSPEPSSFSRPRPQRTEIILPGTLTIALANTHSDAIPLQSNDLSLGTPYEVGLIVTITGCPFANGLFQASSDYLHYARPRPETKSQSNDDILCRSLVTGNVFDMTFMTFGTRRPLGVADKPIPVYAPLSILERQIDIPSAKLGEEWKNAISSAGGRGDTTGKSNYEIVCPSEYEYDLDSDYEDEDAVSSPLPSPPDEGSESASSEGGHSRNETKRSSSSVFVIESTEDVDSVDYDLISEAQRSSSPTAAPDSISIKFAAHKTWHAFLWYCYTGRVRFGKLRSLGVPKQQLEQFQDEPPACSPKSMYRLADILGNKALKTAALGAIRESLTETNVVEEAFSEFTSKYPEVRDVQLLALMEHCQSSEVKEAYLKIIRKSHTIPHAERMLSAFYDKLAA